jgi:hypothetical protein
MPLQCLVQCTPCHHTALHSAHPAASRHSGFHAQCTPLPCTGLHSVHPAVHSIHLSHCTSCPNIVLNTVHAALTLSRHIAYPANTLPCTPSEIQYSVHRLMHIMLLYCHAQHTPVLINEAEATEMTQQQGLKRVNTLVRPLPFLLALTLPGQSIQKSIPAHHTPC